MRMVLTGLTVLALSCSRTPERAVTTTEGSTQKPVAEAPLATGRSLNGTWRALYVEVDGKREARSPADTGRLIIKDTTLAVLEGSREQVWGGIRVDSTATPHTLDLQVHRSGEYQGKRSLAIWELRGDTLRACWTLFALTRPRPTAFKTEKGSGLLLAEYVRDSGPTTTSLQGATLQDTAPSADTIPVKVVERAEEAFWSRDVDALMSFYTPNTEGFVFAAGDSAGRGPAGFTKTQAMYAKTFKGRPQPHGVVLNSIVHGPYVIRQYESGEAARTKFLWMFEVRGGKIRRYWTSPVAAP